MAVKIRQGQVNNEITSVVKDCYSFSDSFWFLEKDSVLHMLQTGKWWYNNSKIVFWSTRANVAQT